MHALDCRVVAQCGGCPFIATQSTERMQMHADRLRERLRTFLGDAALHMPIRWVTLPQPNGYRRRIRLRVVEGSQLGYFNPEKSSDCPVLTRSLHDVIGRLQVNTYLLGEALSTLHHVELREPDDDGRAAAYFVAREGEPPISDEARERLSRWLEGMHWSIAKDSREIPWQRLNLLGVWHYVPISSFLQVNRDINARLVGDLVLEAEKRRVSTFCDLYAGAGNFALPLLALGARGHCVEFDAEAVAAARRAALAQALPGDGFYAADAAAFALHAARANQTFDLVIVDPPRAGVKAELESMAALARRAMVYCSCNPTTMTRDLAQLVHLGLEVASVTLYDMFPHTAHVESMVWLQRHADSTR